MHDDAVLTKLQKNQIFGLIQREGLEPSAFAFGDIHTDEYTTMGSPIHFRASRLVHPSTGYYFIFGGEQLILSPGDSRKVEQFGHEDSWSKKTNTFSKWLIRVKRESLATDLWAALRQEQALGNAASSSPDNNPFSERERSDIGQKVDEIQRYLIEGRQLHDEHARFVQQEMSYLKKAADRLGRKDWFNIALAVLVNIGTTLAMDTNRMKGLMALAGSLFQGLWTEAVKLLS